MPTEIYTMDSLRITIEDDYDEVKSKYEHALRLGDFVIEFIEPTPTLIVVDKITAFIKR